MSWYGIPTGSLYHIMKNSNKLLMFLYFLFFLNTLVLFSLFSYFENMLCMSFSTCFLFIFLITYQLGAITWLLTVGINSLVVFLCIFSSFLLILTPLHVQNMLLRELGLIPFCLLFSLAICCDSWNFAGHATIFTLKKMFLL